MTDGQNGHLPETLGVTGITDVIPMEPHPKGVNPLDMTVSSQLLDQMIDLVIRAKAARTIDIPWRLDTGVTSRVFNQDVRAQFNKGAITWATETLTSLMIHLTIEEKIALKAIAAWTFSNVGGVIRAAVGLIGVAMPGAPRILPDDFPVQETSIANVDPWSATSETSMTLNWLFREATTTDAMEARLDMSPICASYFSTLGKFCKEIRRTRPQLELDRLADYLAYARGQTNERDDPSVDSIPEKCNRALVKSISAMAVYTGYGELSPLRSLLTNGGRLATMVRIRSSDNPTLARLASDVCDIVHSTDRMLSASCVAARLLMERMDNGEIIYDELYAWGGHQHRIMAVEFSLTLAMLTYLIRRADLFLFNDTDFQQELKNIFTYSKLQEVYLAKINEPDPIVDLDN